ncbi:uncharacterized protein CIMG_12944 [Coccidioides immitis RS]|uniref:Uncharacterized protein n=1 Tax=Coccidioides immitis (strain RS) TaxID=246410 RepID=J3K391_COCIM|nr:uncharacterized protein CIMG_12944 [Coccidioides immitis RS]EAS28627.3 hypothetical protein CIMG_12944 [Coccidioides immitis RS]
MGFVGKWAIIKASLAYPTKKSSMGNCVVAEFQKLQHQYLFGAAKSIYKDPAEPNYSMRNHWACTG